MSGSSLRISGLSDATTTEKLALIDELWESVRRSSQIQMRDDHLHELDSRVRAVREDPSIALTPSQARAQLKQ